MIPTDVTKDCKIVERFKIEQFFLFFFYKNIRQRCVHCAVRMWSPLWRCQYPGTLRSDSSWSHNAQPIKEEIFCRGARFQVAGKQKVVGPIILKRKRL